MQAFVRKSGKQQLLARCVHKIADTIDHSLPPAFVFDIDGVLIRGKTVLPAAIEALSKLYSPDKSTPKYPVAFLTNGGGVTEATKAEQLSSWLDVNVGANQVILSHTPFKSFAAHYADKPIVVVGRGKLQDVARSYGFNKTVTTRQLAESMPHSLPFWPGKEEYLASIASNGATPLAYGTIDNPIQAIFIFNDPSDWYMDLQLLSDLITGGGVLNRRHADVPLDTPPVQVFFSNPDLLWANEHSVARFGQGAFAACLEELHRRLTGEDIKSKRVFGKPNREPYLLIEELLLQQAIDLGYPPLTESRAPFSAIFAVGDNPAADVRGANAAGHPWKSVLVRTGVFQSEAPNCHIDPADIVVDDVKHGIDAAFHYLRSAKWHSMR